LILLFLKLIISQNNESERIQRETMNFKKNVFLTILMLSLPIFALNKNNNHQNIAPKIYLDLEHADENYIHQQIDFINYVREREEADIYLLGTRQHTGSGGEKYTIYFIGKNKYNHKDDTLSFNTTSDETWDNIRNRMVKTLKLGLIQYISKTPLASDIKITYKKLQSDTSVITMDKWNNWVFKTKIGGSFHGQETSKNTNLSTQFSAKRITKAWKIESEIDYDYEKNYEELEDTVIKAIKKDFNVDGLIVKSLNSHFSLGSGFRFSSNNFHNNKYSYGIDPAIEYNIYPYSEDNRRSFCFRYEIGFEHINYIDTTIFNKIQENLLSQRLNIDIEFRQLWGEIDFGLEVMNYLPDIDKNHLRLKNSISLHLFKGLSFNIHGGVSLIHDQLSLPKTNVSDIERLMHIKEISSNYDYWYGLGIEYTFGSIYNNIVNPRF